MNDFMVGQRVRLTADFLPAWPQAYSAPAGTLGTVVSLPKQPLHGHGVLLDEDPTGLPVAVDSRELEAI
ncbi:hypothetical protein [Streptomyces sp. NPDC002467]|uniref:hypothetical protein n=1 Tax=Streptomyces sp. NPDC002467 TaxID=3364647 RepID=UPI0036B1018F